MAEFLFQKWDEKARMWSKALEKRGHSGGGLTGSPIMAPFKIVTKRPDVYVFRYLNDYPSLFKSLVRLVSEMLALTFCRIMRINVFWILHNVDRETHQYWPLLTGWRRKLLTWKCERAFVTDSLLIEDAVARYPRLRWSSLCFGVDAEVSPSTAPDSCVSAAINRVRARREKSCGKRVYVGLVVSTITEKCLHLFRWPELLSTDSICLVFVADFSGAGVVGEDLAASLRSHDAVEVVDAKIRVDEGRLSAQYDFIYRSLSDLSVPFTMYRAAAAGRPVITHDVGYVARAVHAYDIGICWPLHGDVGLDAFFERWSPDRWSVYLSERTWENAANSLIKALSPIQIQKSR